MPVVGEPVEVGAGEGDAQERRAESAQRPDFDGDIEAMSLWAGQAVGLVRREQPAAEIMRELVEGARSVMLSSGGIAAR